MKERLSGMRRRLQEKHNSDRGDIGVAALYMMMFAIVALFFVSLIPALNGDQETDKTTEASSQQPIPMTSPTPDTTATQDGVVSMLDAKPEAQEDPKPEPIPTVTVTAQPEPVASETQEAVAPVVKEPIDKRPTPTKQELEPMNWNYLYGFLGIIALIGIIVYAVNKISAMVSQRRLQAERREEALQRWNVLRQRHREMLEKITTYETDIHFAIKYPAMNDPLEPATAAMLEALAHAQGAMRPVPSRGIGGDEQYYSTLSDKVSDLEVKFSTAENNAKKVALTKVSDADRRDFRQAELLLKHVTDSGNTPETRANLANKLKQVVDRINERNSLHLIPTGIVTAIEEHHRLALEAGRQENVFSTI